MTRGLAAAAAMSARTRLAPLLLQRHECRSRRRWQHMGSLLRLQQQRLLHLRRLRCWGRTLLRPLARSTRLHCQTEVVHGPRPP